ncbi:hypothetical protein GJ496_002820 [Pomphorhynchus laevis]|nr:hypothetical protein GJ496_002820 [Pomphorhynchus laevis]
MCIAILTLLLFCNQQSRITVQCSYTEEMLQKYLLKNYNPHIRPVRNVNETLRIDFGLVLASVNNVIEKDQIIKINVWLNFYWKDDLMNWDKNRFDGLETIRLPRSKIWTPDIVLLNNADGNYDVNYCSNIIVSYNGLIQWVPITIYKSTCSLNVRYFPFDQHTCQLRFISFTYNRDEVDFGFYQNKSFIAMSDFSTSGSWNVLYCPGYIRYTRNGTKPEFVFDLVLRRKSLFYIVNLIIPSIIISFITVFMFYLPLDDRERITFGISNLLSINVFLLLVAKLLPPTAVLPYISQYFLLIFITNVAALFATVINLNLRHRSLETHDKRSTFFRQIVFKFLPKMLRIYYDFDNSASYEHLQPIINEPRSLNRLLSSGNSWSYLDSKSRQRKLTRECSVSDDNSLVILDLLTECSSARLDNQNSVIDLLKKNSERSRVLDEWRLSAYIFDRLFLYVFFLVTVIGTLIIGLLVPDIHLSFQPQPDIDAITNGQYKSNL